MKKVKLGDISCIYNGNSINAKVKAEKYSSQCKGLSYIGTKDIDYDGVVTYDTKVIIPKDEKGFKIAPKNCVLVCSEGGSAGRKTAFIDKDICFGNKLYAIVSNPEEINSKYIFYFTRFRNFIEQFNGKMNGIIGGVSTKKFSEILMPLPSLPEQNRIVDKIEELFSELDKSIELLKKAQQQLKVYRQAVLKNAFEICNSTKILSDVCKHITDGDHQAPPKSECGIPFIMISNIQKNIIDFKNTKYVPESYYNQISDKRIPIKGDVLYSVVGSYGIPVLIDYNKKFCFQRHIALLRPQNVLAKYLYYVLQTSDVYLQATKLSTGTAQKTVPLGGLRKIIIPFCTIDEQEKVVEQIESRLSVCDKTEDIINNSLAKADSLRQSILKQAFEGKLV